MRGSGIGDQGSGIRDRELHCMATGLQPCRSKIIRAMNLVGLRDVYAPNLAKGAEIAPGAAKLTDLRRKEGATVVCDGASERVTNGNQKAVDLWIASIGHPGR
jgi:hypothetical protein